MMANMRTAAEIATMAEMLDNDIWEHGWDASVDAACRTLAWVLGEGLAVKQLERYMTRPDAERRREWIARGGNPKDWPEAPSPSTDTPAATASPETA